MCIVSCRGPCGPVRRIFARDRRLAGVINDSCNSCVGPALLKSGLRWPGVYCRRVNFPGPVLLYIKPNFVAVRHSRFYIRDFYILDFVHFVIPELGIRRSCRVCIKLYNIHSQFYNGKVASNKCIFHKCCLLLSCE